MSALGAPPAGSQGAVRRDALRLRMFFHFLMFWVSVRSLREGLGGWFLGDAKAEAILQRGWQGCLYLCAEHLKDEQLDAAADVFEKPISFTKFLVQLRTNPPFGLSPLQALEAQFYDWVDQTPAAPATANSFVQTLSLLEVMRWVLRFEWDNPFTKGGYWYEEKKEIEPDDLRRASAGIPDAAARGIQPGRKDDLAPLLKAYQGMIDSYFKPPEWWPRRFLRRVWR